MYREKSGQMVKWWLECLEWLELSKRRILAAMDQDKNIITIDVHPGKKYEVDGITFYENDGGSWAGSIFFLLRTGFLIVGFAVLAWLILGVL